MKTLFTAAFLLVSYLASAQNSIATGGCGTLTPQSEIEKIYDFVQHNPAAYSAQKTTAALDTIPLSIHIVGTDAGSGYYPLTSLFPMLCQLNQRYIPVGFRFFIKWPIQYINNSAYYIHDFAGGDAMMNQYNVQGAVNVYFVQDPAGACGYYTYNGDAVAIGKGCASPSSTTLTHELGHYFSLAHTFFGWENGNTPSNPEAVRRSGTGTNCSSTGDGFCDTKADYISARWTCPGPVSKTDQFGDMYHLDSSIYMSYSSDACQSRFSAQEIAAMKYRLSQRKASFSLTAIPKARALDTARVIYPRDTMFTNGKKATWHRVPGADYYFVRLGVASAPGVVLESGITSDSSYKFSYAVVDGGEYSIDITPVNAHDFCLQYSAPRIFTYQERYANLSVSGAETAVTGLSIYPNPVSSGAPLQIAFGNMPAGKYAVTLSNISGQDIAQQEITHTGGSSNHSFATPACTNGIYFLRWKGVGGSGAVRVQVGL